MTSKTQSRRPDVQYRAFDLSDMHIETRAGKLPVIEGHAAVFNRFSVPFFGFIEKIAPGAFTRALEEKQDVRALVDHQSNMILGRTKNNTLELREDSHGLKVRIHPPDTTVGRDTVESVRRGDLDQMSFAFKLADGGETVERGKGPNGQDVRTITDADLFDVSVVTFPAYEDTNVGLRQFRSWAEAHHVTKIDEARRLLDSMSE